MNHNISKISSSAYSTSSTNNTLVARDASGGFNAGQVQLMNGDWNTDIPSLILGQNNGLNEGVIQMWNNVQHPYYLKLALRALYNYIKK